MSGQTDAGPHLRLWTIVQHPCGHATSLLSNLIPLAYAGTVNITVYGRDSYLDTQGRGHILYVDKIKGGGSHAILQNGQVIKDVPVNVPDSFRDRIIQDSAGRFYIFGINNIN